MLKKSIFAAIVVSIFCFTGCDLLFSLLSSNNTDEKVDYSNQTLYSHKGNAAYKNNYLIKFNKSIEYELDGAYAGYSKSENVVNETANRSADVSQMNLSKAFDSNGLSKWNDTEAITKLNEIVMKDVFPASRSLTAQNSIESTITKINSSIGDTQPFYYISDSTNYTYSQAAAKCKYTGEHCEVWFINNSSLVKENNLDFDSLGNKFDSIFELETEILGSNIYSEHKTSYIDPQDKIIILILDIFEDASTEQKAGTFGYFSQIDMYTDNAINNSQDVRSFKSNKKQMLYIDSYFYSLDGKNSSFNAVNQIYSTLSHEFNHLLNFCNKTIKNNLDSYETWYTEMLSMITEDMFQEFLGISDADGPKGRLNYFSQFYSYGFPYWRSGDDVYISYANDYAYGAYLIRNHGGIALLKEIATNKYVDGESITYALKEIGETPSSEMKSLGYNTVDFDYTIREFPLVLLNYKNTSDITLNKKAETNSSDLSFTAINLNEFSKTIDKSYKPFIFDSNKYANLGPYGFTIHELSSDTFDYYKPFSNFLEYMDGFLAGKNDNQPGVLYEKLY